LVLFEVLSDGDDTALGNVAVSPVAYDVLGHQILQVLSGFSYLLDSLSPDAIALFLLILYVNVRVESAQRLRPVLDNEIPGSHEELHVLVERFRPLGRKDFGDLVHVTSERCVGLNAHLVFDYFVIPVDSTEDRDEQVCHNNKVEQSSEKEEDPTTTHVVVVGVQDTIVIKVEFSKGQQVGPDNTVTSHTDHGLDLLVNLGLLEA